MGGHNTLNLSVSLHRLHYMLCASYRNSSSEIFSEFHLVERYLGFELSHFPGQGRVLMCGENLQPILVRLAAKLHTWGHNKMRLVTPAFEGQKLMDFALFVHTYSVITRHNSLSC